MKSDKGARGEKGEREGKFSPLPGHTQADFKEKSLCVKVSHNQLSQIQRKRDQAGETQSQEGQERFFGLGIHNEVSLKAYEIAVSFL